MKKIWKKSLTILKSCFSGFVDDKVLKLSASLAYYTVFSMGPLLLMIITLCSIFYGREAVEGKVYGQLEGFTGHDTAIQLQQIIKNAAIMGKGHLAAIIGGVTLLIGATSIFAEIQESINMIWEVKPKPKKGWLKYLQNRFLSFSIIVGMGFLLLVSLAVSALIDTFSDRLKAIYPGVTVIIFYIVNMIISFIVITVIFGTIFKVLPDVKIRTRDVMAGAIMTAVLFMLGKFAISFYISKSHVGTTYGTAGALVIILLWIYYSSVILYFGAEFTKAYILESGSEIYPSEYAFNTRTVEVETTGAKKKEPEPPAPDKEPG
ncbi:MAG TPA: YihY/virulence factor BrkB family protein [Puia sp.]|nr:YihY/virulence factor BrkB family protein [Puia sp.]